MSDENDKTPDGLQSVILTMQILEYVAHATKGVGVTALAHAVGTSKSRAHRHLQTLVQQGYVFQHEDSERYEAGHRLVSLGQSVLDNSGLLRAAHEPLLDLRDRLGHSSVASELTPDGMLVILTVPGRSPIEIGVRVGSLLSFHGSAQGKVAAAFATDEFQARVMRSPLPAHTPETICDSARLAEEFAQIRARGWAAAPNQVALGLTTLASPIFDASGMVCGAAGIVDMVQAIGTVPDADHIEATRNAARQISVKLGSTAPASLWGQ